MAKGKYAKWLEKDGLILLEGWARDGLTDEQIAHNIGINVKTLYEWKNKYSNIDDAIKKGKEVVDILVENALLKRAFGYEYDERKIEIMPDGTKKATMFTRHMPPDTTAQIFWLKNRRPDMWRNVYKDELDHKEQSAKISLMEANKKKLEETSEDVIESKLDKVKDILGVIDSVID